MPQKSLFKSNMCCTQFIIFPIKVILSFSKNIRLKEISETMEILREDRMAQKISKM
jgi:hypothetical protein